MNKVQLVNKRSKLSLELQDLDSEIRQKELKEEEDRKAKRDNSFITGLAKCSSIPEAFNLGEKHLLIRILDKGNFHCSDYSDGIFCIQDISKFDAFCQGILGKRLYSKNRPVLR